MANATTQVKILVPGHQPMVALLGQRDAFLKLIESAFGAEILVRGNEITITGPPDQADAAGRIFEELLTLLERGHDLTDASVGQAIDMVKGSATDVGGEGPIRVSEVLGDRLLTARGKGITPQTIGQKRYVDAIRSSTVTFAIGPAGTGKTYLAVATAVRALQERQVTRLILTRPAVEAGERLGYLPGTLYEKIDPYMRPLYDAMFEMTGADTLSRLMEKGTVEVAPLAYMRGRAQPYSRGVLTPTGFRPIGSLEVGDLVVGSDGLPTPVIGVHPRGRREVFVVRAQDGASTVCCGEHLWAVRTPGDRRRGTGPRVMQTRDMVGGLRAAHHHRFELPLLSAPAEFEPRHVPMDPYALGLLLGDGCMTTTTPSFPPRDPELAAGGRGGVIVANPVTRALRDLRLAGTRSTTEFIPEDYLLNSSSVRLALLQGLLDADGEPVTQRRRTCRIRYTTTSRRLCEDVMFLVRSLGGVAYRRTRAREDLEPGHAGARPVMATTDAYVLDIRLPHGMQPFRLTRKRWTYLAFGGGGRPMRFIDRIEPVGEEETVCIQVAASDSLYVTDDFLLTHNSLNDAFIILDEAQNTTPEQMKMFLTRMGFGSKAVVNGDVTQTDLQSGQASGLAAVEEILGDIEGITFCHLGARDVVRHKIVQDIVEAYRVHGELRSGAGGQGS